MTYLNNYGEIRKFGLKKRMAQEQAQFDYYWNQKRKLALIHSRIEYLLDAVYNGLNILESHIPFDQLSFLQKQDLADLENFRTKGGRETYVNWIKDIIIKDRYYEAFGKFLPDCNTSKNLVDYIRDILEKEYHALSIKRLFL